MSADIVEFNLKGDAETFSNQIHNDLIAGVNRIRGYKALKWFTPKESIAGGVFYVKIPPVGSLRRTKLASRLSGKTVIAIDKSKYYPNSGASPTPTPTPNTNK